MARKLNIAYAWPARFVNSLGSSMVQNAAEGKKLFERIHFNLYLTRLEYFPYRKKFTARLFTSSIYGIAVAEKNASFDLSRSLRSGILYFESGQNFTSSLLTGAATGQVSSIGMNDSWTVDLFYDLYAHEAAHILQYDRKVGGNAFISPLDTKWKSKSKLYNRLSKYIYFDLNGPIFYFAYLFEGSVHSCNLFEQEAENYSNRAAYRCNHR